jgi:soluble lytic murein transglycosylase
VLALLLGIGVLAWISEPELERVIREIDRTSDMRRVEQHASILREAAARNGLDADWLAAIALAESSGRIDAVSSAGALGRVQLMLPTARERATLLGLREPTREELLGDARLNALLAADYLRWLSRRYGGDLERTLIAYNAGPGRLDGWMREAGGYARWRAERERAGDSQVLAYAQKIARYRELFAERGAIRAAFDQPPAPHAGAPPVLASEVVSPPVAYGPNLPPATHVDPVAASSAPSNP